MSEELHKITVVDFLSKKPVCGMNHDISRDPRSANMFSISAGFY